MDDLYNKLPISAVTEPYVEASKIHIDRCYGAIPLIPSDYVLFLSETA